MTEKAFNYQKCPTCTRMMPKWIDCSFNTPKENSRVWGIHSEGSQLAVRRIGGQWKDDSGHFYLNDEITHWMNLPKPPLENEHWIASVLDADKQG